MLIFHNISKFLEIFQCCLKIENVIKIAYGVKIPEIIVVNITGCEGWVQAKSYLYFNFFMVEIFVVMP